MTIDPRLAVKLEQTSNDVLAAVKGKHWRPIKTIPKDGTPVLTVGKNVTYDADVHGHVFGDADGH